MPKFKEIPVNTRFTLTKNPEEGSFRKLTDFDVRCEATGDDEQWLNGMREEPVEIIQDWSDK